MSIFILPAVQMHEDADVLPVPNVMAPVPQVLHTEDPATSAYVDMAQVVHVKPLPLEPRPQMVHTAF